MSEKPTLTFETRDGVGTIAFDRPPANAYEIGFHRQFAAVLAAVEADPDTRVVVLRSRVARFFSAGADVKVFAANSAAANREMVEAARAALARIELSGKPFLACLEGHALGGGLEIALACDLRFAARGDFKLGLPEVRLGLIPGNGGTQRLARLVGACRAFALLATGESIGPDEAHRIGLVNALFDPDRIGEETERFARTLAQGAPLALAALKRAVRDGSALALSGALQLEAALVDRLYETADAREGFRAALEKRPPIFRGE